MKYLRKHINEDFIDSYDNEVEDNSFNDIITKSSEKAMINKLSQIFATTDEALYKILKEKEKKNNLLAQVYQSKVYTPFNNFRLRVFTETLFKNISPVDYFKMFFVDIESRSDYIMFVDEEDVVTIAKLYKDDFSWEPIASMYKKECKQYEDDYKTLMKDKIKTYHSYNLSFNEFLILVRMFLIKRWIYADRCLESYKREIPEDLVREWDLVRNDAKTLYENLIDQVGKFIQVS